MDEELDVTEINDDSEGGTCTIDNDPIVLVPSSDSEDEINENRTPRANARKRRYSDKPERNFLNEMEQKLVTSVCDISSNIAKMARGQSEMVDALREISLKLGILINTLNTSSLNHRVEINHTQQISGREIPLNEKEIQQASMEQKSSARIKKQDDADKINRNGSGFNRDSTLEKKVDNSIKNTSDKNLTSSKKADIKNKNKPTKKLPRILRVREKK